MNFNQIEFYDRQPGIAPSDASSLNFRLQSKLTADEIERLSKYPLPPDFPQPEHWQIELRDLPVSYLELLCESDGGGIIVGDRELGFFGQTELREYLLEYQFPVYMPNALPFGLNGGGVFYVFDMREPPSHCEFPILATTSGNIGFEDAPVIANTLEQLLSDPTNIEDLL